MLYYSTELFIGAGLASESAKYATIGKILNDDVLKFILLNYLLLKWCVGVGAIMVGMTLVSIPLMDRAGRRTLHLWGLGGMFIFSIFITISLLVMVSLRGLQFWPIFPLCEWHTQWICGLIVWTQLGDQLHFNIYFGTGTNRMGSLRSRGRYTYLCIVFCCWTRLHSMDDYSRVIQSRTTTSRDVHRRTRQLAGEFSCRSLLLTSQGKLKKKKKFLALQAHLLF